MFVIFSGIFGISAYSTLPQALSTNRGELTQGQMLDALRAHSFEVAPYNGIANGKMVSKDGVAAVLVPGKKNNCSAVWDTGPATATVSTTGNTCQGPACSGVITVPTRSPKIAPMIPTRMPPTV